MEADSKSKYTQTDRFLCKEFFAGKSVSILVRDFMLVHHCSRGEAEEAVYHALNNFAYDYEIDFV